MSNINLYLKIVASADIAIVEVQNARIFFHKWKSLKLCDQLPNKKRVD
jgi:hypothetical protein